MSVDDEVVVLRRAGLESAAKVVEAARAGQVEAQPPTVPAAPAADPALAAVPAAVPAIPSASADVVPAAAGIVPGGEVTREQLKSMNANEIAALPQATVSAAMAEGGRR